jgi:type IV secretory pathway TraG/TraD family ATPase VirD4
LHAALREWIYRDQTLSDLAMPALWGSLAVFVVGLVVAIPKDIARARERRHGRRLKGPELVTAAAFNRRTRADGIGFVQTPSFVARLCGRRRWVRVPRGIESSHVLMMGDSGTGKSALIRQILRQLGDRGDTAIVYDPALEYTPQFYTPERGDVILNPLDARSPYWSPGDELRHDAEALTLATSLFPDRHHENQFFTKGPRRIFAHLLTFRPTAQELASWLCHEDELDRRVLGTSYAAMIDRQAPAQRSGVLASLNMVADTLKLLPTETETTQRWSAAGWARERQGWLFLTSTPETRTRLVPLTSLWLDMLVLRLMSVGQPSQRPVWFILDELASLQRLPQLHTAITENRKSNNPVVLGFQGRSQLETRYGHDAEAMLSQPATKVFLRTSEPHAAKWISDTIGEVEIERLRESRSKGQWAQQSYGLERQVEPLVMASEISGLADLHGYLKMGNLVARLRFPFTELPKLHPALIERPIPAPRAASVPAAPPVEPHETPAQRLAPRHLTQTSEPASQAEAFFR